MKTVYSQRVLTKQRNRKKPYCQGKVESSSDFLSKHSWFPSEEEDKQWYDVFGETGYGLLHVVVGPTNPAQG